jgi:hypothetical protein
MKELESTLDALVAGAPVSSADWQDVVGRAGRPRRRALAVLAVSAVLGAIVVATPAFGIGERIRGLFDGTPVDTESLPSNDLHVASAMVHGVSPRVPVTGREARLRGAATEVRQLASRNGRNFFVIENPHGDRCFAVGPVEKHEYVFGQVGCSRSPVFPSPARPIFDFSVFSGLDGPRVRRIEGFAADGITQVGVVTEDGDVEALTDVENNVYSREGDLPKQSVRELVALDAHGERVYSMCLVRGGCAKE